MLIYALMKGALTWDQVLTEFGEPSDSWNEYKWQEVTAEIRHGGDQVFQRNIANLIEPRSWHARMTALWNEGTPEEQTPSRLTI